MFSNSFSAFRRFNSYSYLKNVYILKHSVVKRNSSSTSSAHVEQAEETQESVGGEVKNKLKGPFVKNLFAGIYDDSILEYPEYPNKEEVEEINSRVRPVQEYFEKCVDSSIIDETKTIPLEVDKFIKENNIYGVTVPNTFGGLHVDDRCFARYYEAIGSDMSISSSLAAHNRAVDILSLYGSNEQKSKYLRKLASGEFTFGFCLLEKPNAFDISDMEMTALQKDGEWVINGKKIWVVNASKASGYFVLAKTWSGSMDQADDSVASIFLIDKNTPGVHCNSPIEQLGTRGVEVCDVTFDNVVITNDCMIGELGTGMQIAMDCLSRGRLGTAASAISYLKNMLNVVTDHVNNSKASGKTLSSFEFVQRKLGEIAGNIYALESMVYLTAGVKDTFDNPDMTIEESIVKVFSMEKIAEVADLCATLVGGYAYVKGSPFEHFIRDSRSYLFHDIVPINITKIYIATLGIQHAGLIFNEDVKKARNPLNFPGSFLKYAFKEFKSLRDDIKVPGILRLQLHPSLSGDADKIEASVLRLDGAVSNLLRRWGIEILDRQMDLIRLADCAVSLYAMTAVAGRCSRSYCIGLANNNAEVSVSNVFINVHHDFIRDTVDRFTDGPYATYDANYMAIGEKVASLKGYFFEHPLSRNY